MKKLLGLNMGMSTATLTRFAVAVITAAILGGCSESCEGDDGADGQSCWQEEQNGKTMTCCYSKTKPGEKECHDYTGDRGPAGPPGPTGPAGASCHFENETAECADLVCGTDRRTICNGSDGLNGTDGLDGLGCDMYEDGDCVVVYCDSGSYKRLCPPGTPNPGCQPVVETGDRCHDKVDNDCDGLVDSSDPDCQSNPPTGDVELKVCTVQIASNEYGLYKDASWQLSKAVQAQQCAASSSCWATVMSGQNSDFGTSYYNEQNGQWEVGCFTPTFSMSHNTFDALWAFFKKGPTVSGHEKDTSGGYIALAVASAVKQDVTSGSYALDVTYYNDPGPVASVLITANSTGITWASSQTMSLDPSMPTSFVISQGNVPDLIMLGMPIVSSVEVTEEDTWVAASYGNQIPKDKTELQSFKSVRDAYVYFRAAAGMQPPPAQE